MDIRVVTEQPEPGQHLHQFRRPACRLRRPRNCRSTPQGTVSATTQWDADPTKSNLGTLDAGVAERQLGRSDRQQVDPLRQDRRLSRHARQRAGAGAEPARQPRRRRWRRRCRTPPSTEPPSAPAPQTGFDVDTAGLLNGNRINLTYTDTVTNTQHQVSIVRVDDPAALPLEQHGDRRSERRGGRRRFLRRACLGRQPSSTRSSAPGCNSPIRPARRCRCWTTAPPTPPTSMPCRSRKTATALAGGNAGAAAVHRRRRRRSPARSPRIGAQTVGFAGRIAVNPALLGDPTKLDALRHRPRRSAIRPVRISSTIN